MVLPLIQSLTKTPGTQSVQYLPQGPGCHPVPQLKEVELLPDLSVSEEGAAEVVLCARMVKRLDKEVEPIQETSNHWPAQNVAYPCFVFLPAKETGYSRIGFPGL